MLWNKATRFEYRIEIIRFDPQLVEQVLTFTNAGAAAAAISEVSDETVVIAVTQRRNNFCVGDFSVWRSAGRTLVRLGEHRNHDGRQLFDSDTPTGEVAFRDDDGSNFYVPFAETVDVDVANSAMLHWIVTGDATGALLWS